MSSNLRDAITNIKKSEHYKLPSLIHEDINLLIQICEQVLEDKLIEPMTRGEILDLLCTHISGNFYDFYDKDMLKPLADVLTGKVGKGLSKEQRLIIEDTLRKKILFIGGNQQTYTGAPIDLINELAEALTREK